MTMTMTTTMGQLCNFVHGLRPALMMVVAQVAFGGVNLFYKLAANDGMSLRVLVAYRMIFAAAFMLPLAFFLERKKRPKLTWMVVFQAFLCGLFGGSLNQNLYLGSLALTSATFASAMANLAPAITFVLAVSFRLEKLGIETRAGKAKVLGTLMGIAGAMLLTFYKGIQINLWSTHIDFLNHGPTHASHVSSLHANPHARLWGALLSLASCVSYTLWLITQAKMSERYPCQYSSTAMMCVMGSIQAVVYALCVERDWSQWKLGLNIRLLTASYSGIVGSGLVVTLISWCVRMRGPLFASVFTPLMLVVVAILGSLLLDEKLYLGSILGATLIVCGLYAVLWGKSKEMKKKTQLVPYKSGSNSPNNSELHEIVVTTSNNNIDEDPEFPSKEIEAKDENNKQEIKENGEVTLDRN